MIAPHDSAERFAVASELMRAYVDRTAARSQELGKRYLWTDSFAVCNLLGLARRLDDSRHRDDALALIDAVHRSLGRHRPDDARKGWISGLDDSEGQVHPTVGGLRIGKELPERRDDEPFDEQREWDRDGQYFHYLTKWMHALDQAGRMVSQPVFGTWARELARAAFEAFTYRLPGVGLRMHWKMSIDLSRPLVRSMGAHDPLDAYVTCIELRATASLLPAPGPDLDEPLLGFSEMIDSRSFVTADPLGIGGLLSDACRLVQLTDSAAFEPWLLESLLGAALTGLRLVEGSSALDGPPERRVAFRELGLAIGLRGIGLVSEIAHVTGPIGARITALVRQVASHGSLAERIESFWRDPRNQRTRRFREHRDINEVMLATSLVPEGSVLLSGLNGARRPV